jgi:anti-sigma B factor antagonist
VPVVQGPSSFEVNSTRGDDTLIILASGELAYQRTEAMRTEIDKAWQSPQPALMIIDVSSVVFCDATGLCELTRALQLSRSTSVRLILTGAQGNLRHLLTITGLDRIFQTSPSTTEALKSA